MVECVGVQREIQPKDTAELEGLGNGASTLVSLVLELNAREGDC